MDYMYHNWFVEASSDATMRCSKTVFFGNNKNTRGKMDLKWSNLVSVSMYDGDGHTSHDKVTTLKVDIPVLTFNPLEVTGETVTASVLRSIGNSGNAGEKRALSGYVLLGAKFNGTLYEKWFSLQIEGSKQANPLLTPVSPAVGGILYSKSEKLLRHTSVPIFHELSECNEVWHNPQIDERQTTGGLRSIDMRLGYAVGNTHPRALHGESIVIAGEVWGRIGPSGTDGTNGAELGDSAMFSWTCPVIDINAPVRVTCASDVNIQFALRPGRYVLPPDDEANTASRRGPFFRMTLSSMGGTMNRAKNAIGSATKISRLGKNTTKKTNTQRVIKRL
jgi:hypothetical protein